MNLPHDKFTSRWIYNDMFTGHSVEVRMAGAEARQEKKNEKAEIFSELSVTLELTVNRDNAKKAIFKVHYKVSRKKKWTDNH